MSSEIFYSRECLKNWLAAASGIVLTSIAVLSDIKEIEFQFPNPSIMAKAMEDEPSYFPEGKYIVSYKNSETLDDNDLDYSKMVMVISFEARLSGSDLLIGGFQSLTQALSEFEYCCVIDRTNSDYITAGFWVVEPNRTEDLHKLKVVLEQHAVFYAFNDGTGYVTINNGRMGNGISSRVKI